MAETQVVSKQMEKSSKKMKQHVSDFDEEAVTDALRARIEYFKEQADSLTFEGVRRVLEKDLGLDEFALDPHKRFVRQTLEKFIDENASKSPGKTDEAVVDSAKNETLDLSEKHQLEQEADELEDGKKTHGSPGTGLVAGGDAAKNDTEKTSDVVICEDIIKKAISDKSAYFRANSSTLTLIRARRLLEEDLKLEKGSLDSYKKLIREQVDQVMEDSSAAEPANEIKNKRRKKVSSGKTREHPDSSDEMEEEEVKPKKKSASKKIPDSAGLKKRKGPAEEINKSSKKQKPEVESMSEGSDRESSDKEPVKKKSEASTQVYGKRVEHLKTVIRSCGMSVPPAVYKRAKQAPENKREACLIKELEEILRKEGLSANPSEKEIKAVKKQKERTKELEGIDLSNIVSSSRRRSTSSFVPPPPKISVGSDDEGDEDDEEENDDDEDDNEDGSDDGNEDDDADDNKSEELNEDAEDEESD